MKYILLPLLLVACKAHDLADKSVENGNNKELFLAAGVLTGNKGIGLSFYELNKDKQYEPYNNDFSLHMFRFGGKDNGLLLQNVVFSFEENDKIYTCHLPQMQFTEVVKVEDFKATKCYEQEKDKAYVKAFASACMRAGYVLVANGDFLGEKDLACCAKKESKATAKCAWTEYTSDLTAVPGGFNRGRMPRDKEDITIPLSCFVDKDKSCLPEKHEFAVGKITTENLKKSFNLYRQCREDKDMHAPDKVSCRCSNAGGIGGITKQMTFSNDELSCENKTELPPTFFLLSIMSEEKKNGE